MFLSRILAGSVDVIHRANIVTKKHVLTLRDVSENYMTTSILL